MRQNLSSVFPIISYQNQPSQPQRLDRIVKSGLELVYYDTIQFVNSKGADQTARMRKLICAFVVCRPRWQNSSRTFNLE